MTVTKNEFEIMKKAYYSAELMSTRSKIYATLKEEVKEYLLNECRDDIKRNCIKTFIKHKSRMLKGETYNGVYSKKEDLHRAIVSETLERMTKELVNDILVTEEE